MIRLYELRKERKISQDVLAKILNVTRQSYSRYEREEHELGYGALNTLAKYFDVSIEYLLGFSDLYYPKSINSEFSSDEVKLIEDFRQLNFYKQELIKNNIKAMLPTKAESKQKKKGN